MMTVTVAIRPVTTATSPLLLNSIHYLFFNSPPHHSIRNLMRPVRLLLTNPRAIASPWPRCSNGASRNLAMAMAMARVLPCEHRKHSHIKKPLPTAVTHYSRLSLSLSLSYSYTTTYLSPPHVHSSSMTRWQCKLIIHNIFHITLFKFIIVFCETDNISWNIIPSYFPHLV